MEVVVQFVNWNSENLIHNHIHVLNGYKGSISINVIVIDNSGEYSICSKEILLRSKVNLGYAGGNNLSLNIIKKFDYLLVVKPDVREVNWENIFHGLNNLRPDIISVKGNNPSFDGLYWNFVRSYWQVSSPSLYGSFFGIRTNIYTELGGFNPSFFMYHEEHEFAIRAIKAGYKIVTIDRGYVRPLDDNMIVSWKWKFRVINSLKTYTLHYPIYVRYFLVLFRYYSEVRSKNMSVKYNKKWLRKVCVIALQNGL